MLTASVLRDWQFELSPHAYDERDVMLYALAAGFAQDPANTSELDYVYEKNLQVVPSIASLLCAPGSWTRDPRTGIDANRVVHAEHDIRAHQALLTRDRIEGRAEITALVDKGPQKGALLEVTRDLYSTTGAHLVTQRHLSFCRGDGGFSAENGEGFGQPEVLPDVPGRAPDFQRHEATDQRAALFYRLLGDFNPLHVDSAAARLAGYPRPLLHGLCVFGMATRVVLEQCCGYRASRLRRMSGRFSGPVFPGETLEFRLWRKGHHGAHLQIAALDRDVVVLDRGWFEFDAPQTAHQAASSAQASSDTALHNPA